MTKATTKATQRCDNCNWEGVEEEVTALSAKQMLDRWSPGDVMATGFCPKCDCLTVYPISFREMEAETKAADPEDAVPTPRPPGTYFTLMRGREVACWEGDKPEDTTPTLFVTARAAHAEIADSMMHRWESVLREIEGGGDFGYPEMDEVVVMCEWFEDGSLRVYADEDGCDPSTKFTAADLEDMR